MEKIIASMVVFLSLGVVVAVFICDLEYPPLNELNPKAQSVIIDDDTGNYVRIDKVQIKTIHAEGSCIYIYYGNRDKRVLKYSNAARRREMLQRMLIWWKADQEKE